MRIRSIKPEFWRSEDIAALTIPDRLLFIGLWSYVDDNGVGRDRLADIAADLFAPDLEQDPQEAYGRVRGGLRELSRRGLIHRYEADDKRYLSIATWKAHQRIDKPSAGRYPLPTTEDVAFVEPSGSTPGALREPSTPGTEEQGNRGTVNTCAPADAEREFETWYLAYPRKRAKGQAAKAYRTARKTTDAETLLAAITAQAPSLIAQGADYIPYPATWLNGRRWLDEITAVQGRRVVVAANGVQQEVTW